MTPKEKASSLTAKYRLQLRNAYMDFETANELMYAKVCATIAAGEAMAEAQLHDKTIHEHSRIGFWIEVIDEISKI